MSLYDKANKIFIEKYAAEECDWGHKDEIRSRQVKAALEAVEKEMAQLEKRLRRAIEAASRFPADPNP
jgi:hypothetical protein